ncbi:formate acetyltransferase 3 [Salmonella enterica subsp. enterica]|uniref:Formate acetyltransferase 3 n=1 Tax=Salmonella enterica I TaxID=59201 RepID=A0A3S5DN31_SALET|nr:formate acetyltransferase 3 [Salmonella enterica subsp. enterica]
MALSAATITPVRPLSQQTCRLAPRLWLTPDGRKAHTPLAEGASPASGTDHLGPTAVIGSVGKLPTGSILGGVLLNQKLNPTTLENESDKQKLMVLLRTFFEVA